MLCFGLARLWRWVRRDDVDEASQQSSVLGLAGPKLQPTRSCHRDSTGTQHKLKASAGMYASTSLLNYFVTLLGIYEIWTFGEEVVSKPREDMCMLD